MDALADWFTHYDNTHWFVLAFILLIAELATGTTYLLWPAVAAGVVGLTSLFFGWPMPLEITLFAGLTIALTLIGRPLARARALVTSEAPLLNERGQAMIGAHGVAAGAFAHGVGSVKLNDSIWRATSDEPIHAGQNVEVVRVDGSVLSVKPIG